MSRSTENSKPDPLVGKVIDGRYTIEKPLASGGMGSVYLARQRNLARPVAIKVVTGADEELVERFRREADALADASHPAIVEVHDFIQEGEDQQRCYLVMTFVEGQDLEDYLDQHPKERVRVDEAVALMIPIVSALVQLHAAGIVHRDIKPANIIRFQGADGRPAVKLVDFGIARRAVDPGLTNAGYIIGTPPYMSPETLLATPHTPVADVYAVGATLFELLTGAAPFGNGRLHEVMGRALKDPVPLPGWLRATPLGELLLRMLAKEPADRPDALQVLEALERIQDELAAARVASGASLVTPGLSAPPGSTAETRVHPGGSTRDQATVQLTPRPTQPGAASSGVTTAASPTRRATAVAPPARTRSRWHWLGPLLAVPVVIAIVAVTLVWSGSKSEKARGAQRSSKDADAAAEVMRKVAARRVRARPRETPRPREALPSGKELGRHCKSHDEAARFFHTAKQAARTRAGYDKALTYYRAVLNCGYAYAGERRWAARLMANIYIRKRLCRSARALWRIYQELTRKAGKRAKPFPGCT